LEIITLFFNLSSIFFILRNVFQGLLSARRRRFFAKCFEEREKIIMGDPG
jgi:hypothetical protein